MRRARFALVALAALGCGRVHAGSATKVCDPLADEPRPIALGTVLGAGKDGSGVVYVIDRPAQGEERLFVSDGMNLVRQPVGGAGSGSAGGGGTFEIVNSGTGAAALAVEIMTDAAGNVTMGVFRGALATKTFTIGSQGEQLTGLAAGALDAYTLENLPGTIYIEYVATLADGRLMVVTRPEVDWTYADFRLFMSEAAGATLAERKVASVVRGSATDILFDLDGAQATAHFGSSLAPGPSTLTVGAQSFELTVTPPNTPPTDVTFGCF